MNRSKALSAFVKSSVLRALFSLTLVFLLGVIFNADGAFLKWDTHRDMLRQVSVFGILACGMTFVIISGGIDLSVGSILGFAAVLFSLFSIHLGWSPLAAIGLTLILGMIAGSISGLFVAKIKIQSFIATLAMMVFARGVAKLVSGGQKISTAVQLPDGNYQYVDIPGIYNLLNAKVL